MNLFMKGFKMVLNCWKNTTNAWMILTNILMHMVRLLNIYYLYRYTI